MSHNLLFFPINKRLPEKFVSNHNFNVIDKNDYNIENICLHDIKIHYIFAS